MSLIFIESFVILMLVAITNELIVTGAATSPKLTVAQDICYVSITLVPIVALLIPAYYIGKLGSKRRNGT